MSTPNSDTPQAAYQESAQALIQPLTQPLAQPLTRDRENRQNFLLVLLSITVLVGGGIYWLQERTAEQSRRDQLPQELRDEPDLYVNDAVIHQFHPDGGRKYLLRASIIKHFNNQELTRMEQPDLLLEAKTENAAPWQATSNYGYVRKQQSADGVNEEVVFLRDNVELSQTREPPRYLSVRSSALYLYPDREYVETDESVTIDTHTGRTRADAMRGDLSTGVLRLTGDTTQVQTIVLPFQFK